MHDLRRGVSATSVNNRLIFRLFNTLTRFRHGLVHRHARTNLSTTQTHNHGNNHGGQLSPTGRRVTLHLCRRQRRAITRVYQVVNVNHSALCGCLARTRHSTRQTTWGRSSQFTSSVTTTTQPPTRRGPKAGCPNNYSDQIMQHIPGRHLSNIRLCPWAPHNPSHQPQRTTHVTTNQTKALLQTSHHTRATRRRRTETTPIRPPHRQTIKKVQNKSQTELNRTPPENASPRRNRQVPRPLTSKSIAIITTATDRTLSNKT